MLFPTFFSTFFVTLFFTLLVYTLSPSIVHAQQSLSPTIEYEIIRTDDHNANSFIQGWIKENNTFYESSGLYHQSFVERYNDPKNTANTLRLNLPAHYFAEGLTLLNDTLYLLTWKAETLLLLDKETLEISQRLSYKGEGWGLTHNHQQLIMSNGTPQLLFRDANTFSIQKTLDVHHYKNPKTGLAVVAEKLQLNELEYVDGIIWANNWNNNNLYAINSQTGCIIGTADLSTLRQNTVKPDHKNVVNGIAYDKQREAFWVTGKLWPKRYLLRLSLPEPKNSAAILPC